MTWTNKQEKRLVELWNQGVSVADISKELGICKNGIIGKSWRMGLRRERKFVPKETKFLKGRIIKPRKEKKRENIKIDPFKEAGDKPTLGESNGCLSLTGRHDGRGFPTVCGKPRARLSFCPYHANLYYVKPNVWNHRPRRRKGQAEQGAVRADRTGH